MEGNVNIVSLSGGKDSTATALLAIHHGTENLRFVFADTGNEHPLTYAYVNYLDEWLRGRTGVGIDTLRADFSDKFERRREYIREHWPTDGVSAAHVEEAIELTQATGNPYLDLCILKGRFPSRKAQFCTQELKTRPLGAYQMEFCARDRTVWSWQGVRADESARRAKLRMTEDLGGFGVWAFRPLLHWKVDDVFAMHWRFGVKPNPLYTMGMNRVGCMPCINCAKDELLAISQRFPEHIDRIERWEALVFEVAKRGCATFFATRDKFDGDRESYLQSHGVRAAVKWSKTSRGGQEIRPIENSSRHKSVFQRLRALRVKERFYGTRH
ncbi:MAG TPA: phosphoadenosine phosphosulfate reductase family protein [Gammaproteobacteria bacterium]|nr:phosphoadenosine phosphosulfate reductase family protein [Gammaproteobacteria bacterium]